MARSPIEIGIASETKAFRQGIESGIIDPLEDAEKALQDLAKTRGPEQLERDMRDAQKQTEKLKDETKDTARAIERDFADSYRSMKRDAEDAGDAGVDGMHRIKGGAQELQAEIGSNLGEAVSSFRGDISDLGQVGQDTLGGLAATVASAGPAGLLGAFALAAGAAGLGLFTANQEIATEKQELLNESAARFASGYTEGINGALSAAYVFAEINAIATDPERYKEAQDAANDWGVDVRTAMGALAGDATALATAQGSLDARTREANARLAEQEQAVDGNAGAVYDLDDAVKRGAERMETLNGAMAAGKEQADNAAGALFNYASSAGVATDQTDDLGNKIVRLPDGKEIVIDAETQRAYEDIDTLEKQRLNDKTLTVRILADRSDFDYKMRQMQDRANQGVTLQMNPRMGAVYQ